MNSKHSLISWSSILLVVIFTLHPPSVVAQGTTYYVAVTGTDGPVCGTIASPCRTIQYAANLVAPGDTVLINPGTYTGGITVETGGTASATITFRANGSGVIVEGSGGERDAFFITWADYVVVEGLTIQHAARAGMRIDNSHHVTVRNCTFVDNVTWGLFTDFGDYTTVENCESYGAAEEHGIYISNSSDYPTIRGNRLHHNSGCGLHMNGDVSMGGDGIISYALVERNIIYENGVDGGSGINMDGVTHSVIRNNLLYSNHASGISLYQIDGGSGSHHNRVLNNTIIMPDNGRWAINIPDPDPENPAPSPSSYNKLFNNIIYNYHSWRGSITIGPTARTGFESDYNVVMDRFSTDGGDTRIMLAQWRALGYDTHSIIASPALLFVDVSSNDYHLKVGSPAIDLGTLLADVPDDLEGNSRPAGSTHDAGAYEFVPSLDLRATPADRAIHLSWQVNTTLPPAATWRVEYYTQTATIYTATDPYSATRSLTLTQNVHNYQWYTVTLHAMDGAASILSDTVRVMPTDRFVYLPLVLKGH